jgi:hypothetical protein
MPFIMHRNDRRSRLLCYLLFPLVIGSCFMTGSRWPVFFLGIFAVGFLGTVSFMNVKSVKQVKLLVLPLSVTALVVLVLFSSSLTGWFERVEGASASGDTFMGRSFQQFVFLLDPAIFSILGDGIGSTNNAAQAIGDIVGMPVNPSPRPVEAEPGRVMAEIGAPGFLLWYGLRAYLIISLFRTARRLKEPFLKSLAIAAGWFVLVGIMAPVPFDTTLAAFYWLTAGFAVLLPYLDKHPGGSPAARTRATVPAPAALTPLPG